MSTGPFIAIHQKLSEHDGATGYVLSVEAVVDLDEARRLVEEERFQAYLRMSLSVDRRGSRARTDGEIAALGSGGGEVDLPDGSQVVVEATTRSTLIDELMARVDWAWDDPSSVPTPEIVATWNRYFGRETS